LDCQNGTINVKIISEASEGCQGEKGGITLNDEGDSDGKNSAIGRVSKGSLFFTTTGGLGHTEQKATLWEPCRLYGHG
jgi:hypothetical protein